ncbi:hypothetical protein DFP72DRAFT_750916, partial [Ephemerocybe angulata]
FVTLPKKKGAGWTTRCHYHTTLDQMAIMNDVYSRLVTGVPYQRSEGTEMPAQILKLTPKSKRGVVFRTPGSSKDATQLATPPSNRLTRNDWLQFYLMDDEGRHFLHCGCLLEEVLLDFYLWKSAMPLYSVSTGRTEPLGNPMDPRTRAFYHQVLKGFGVDVMRLYKFDING